jgi:hypothetical protein
MRACGQCHTLAVLPPEKTQYPLYRRLTAENFTKSFGYKAFKD